MAVEVMDWVWTHSKSRNGARLVLLAIADCCSSSNGTGAFPSMAALMAKTGLTDRAIQKSLTSLTGLKELKVELNAGPGGCNRYTVMMTPEKSSGANILHPEDSSGANIVRGSEFPQVNGQDPEHCSPRIKFAPPNDVRPEPSVVPKKRTSSAKRRATRIPQDFTATAEMVAWARAEVPGVDGRRETQKFINYYIAAPDSKGKKVDWVATWRNWMLNADDRTSVNGSRPMAPASNAPVAIPAAEKCPEHPSFRVGACPPCKSEMKARKAS